MLHIIMACIHHETNTFSSQKTGFAEYKSRAYALGQEIILKYKGTQSEVGGFIAEAEKYSDVNLIPVIMADAQPSGPVTSDFFSHVCDEMKAAILKCEKVDGVLLSLHGAMVTEDSLDGEGDLLELIRDLVGDNVPIAATLDLHSIVTEKKAENANILINYDEYPHTDMFERGVEAAKLLIDTLHGEIRPVMVCKKVPIIQPLIGSVHPVMKKHMDRVHEYEKEEGVLSVSLSHGFPYADVPELGISVEVITDDDKEQAEKIASELAEDLWKDRVNLKGKFYSANDAVEIAKNSEEGPVILADVTDNPGGGAACDGTVILKEMIDAGLKNAVVAQIYDPESLELCHKAGVGHTVDLTLGGKYGPTSAGNPIACKAYVKVLTDGNYTNRDSINGGYPITLGNTALIDINGIEVIITASTEQPFDTEMLYSHGVDPCRKKCILLKSTVHYRAAYESLAAKILPVHVDGGMLQQDVSKIPYKNVLHPIYPLDSL